MKNKKIISLTVFAVALVLAGVLGLSKIFENGWQQEKQTDNSINVNITGYEENAKVDYPYTIGGGNADADDFSNILSYQQAANISGDAILYLSGITEHQKVPGEIYLYKKRWVSVAENEQTLSPEITDRYNYLEYYYSVQIDTDLSDETCPKYIRTGCSINAETGEILGVYIEDYRKHGQDYSRIEEEYMPKQWQERKLSRDEIKNNLDYIQQISDELGWNCSPAAYNMLERGTPYGMAYIIEILMDNNKTYTFVICSEDGNIEKGSLIEAKQVGYMPENLVSVN